MRVLSWTGCHCHGHPTRLRVSNKLLQSFIFQAAASRSPTSLVRRRRTLRSFSEPERRWQCRMQSAMGRVLIVAVAAVSVPISRSMGAVGMDSLALPQRGLHLRNMHFSGAEDCIRMAGSAVEHRRSLNFVSSPWIAPMFRPAAVTQRGFLRRTARFQRQSVCHGLRSVYSSTDSRHFAQGSETKGQPLEGPRVSLLNKFIYQESLQCPKLGWHRRRNLVREEPTEAEMLLAQQGEQIEAAFLDHRYGGSAKEIEPSNLKQQATDTRTEMRQIAERFGKEVPNVKKQSAVTQATFIAGNCVARADAVEYVGDGQWDLLEVKSCTDKNYGKHLPDLAFTVHTAMESGVKVRCALLVVINSDFRMGMPPNDIFKILNCTDELFDPHGPIATLQAPISNPASLASVTSVTSLPEAPRGVMTSSCKACPLFAECVAKGVEHPIWHLPRLTGKRFQQVISQSLDIKDVEDELLTAPQRKHKACVIKGEPLVARKCVRLVLTVGVHDTLKALRKGLAALRAPLYFLDFESFSTWTPTLPGQAPLEQVVSQYSLHISESLDVGTPEDVAHREFLADAEGDFRADLLEAMLADLGSSGSIIVYSPYEKTQLSKMASLFPLRKQEIDAVVARLVDLEPLIRANVHHPEFYGRTSLKVTLPVLVPSYIGRYKALNINDGAHAAAVFQRIRASPDLSHEERAELRSELLEYCRLDTLAMVELLQALTRLAEDPEK